MHIPNPNPNLPTGTVTFLFTDIEGSTTRWEHNPGEMQAAFSRQEAIVRHAIEANQGYAYKMIGDAFQAAFSTASQALQAALDAQRILHAEPWGEVGELRVRMALHTGVTEERGGDYVGPVLNRVARLLSAGHGGQVLLALSTQELVRDYLPSDVTLRDLGGHRLKDLTRPEHIFQLVTPDLPSDFPPLKTLDSRPNNLPLQPTHLIGREKELADVEKLLDREDVRLLTLTGPGGTGKTRLALQVAGELVDHFADGAYFVDFAPLADPALVVSQIAQPLGVREAGGQPLFDTLKAYLKNRQMLLVLDNYEHLLAAAGVAGQLLQAAPGLKVLVTSRVPIHIRGEKEYAVPPLQLPDTHHLPPLEQLTQYEAVRLFIERATDIRPDFAVTNDNAPAVAEICVRLDGLPLAIELVAARIRLLPPQAMLSRLQNRLKLLTGGSKDLTARQQTLRGTIDWSYDLLGEGEKQLFRRLAVFVGGRTLEAVEAICNSNGDLQVDVLDGVESLVSKSLMRQEEGAMEEPRFVMLETIHEYAREKLEESGEAEEMQRRHALYFMALAEEAFPKLFVPEQTKWLNRLKEEHDNVRAALAWCWGEVSPGGVVRDAEVGARLAIALHLFWYLLGYIGEGREWFDKALAGTRGLGNTWIRATVLLGAGAMAMWHGDLASGRRWLEESITIWRELGNKESLAKSLFYLGVAAVKQGGELAASPALEECLLLLQELGEQRSPYYSLALLHLGDVALGHTDLAQARSRYEESLALIRETGDMWGVAQAMNNLGEVARCEGDYGRAESLYTESAALFKEFGSPPDIARSLHNLGYVAHHQGNYHRARELFTESLLLFREHLNRRGIAECLAGLASVVGAQEEPGLGVLKAVRLLAVTEAQFEAIGAAMWPADRIEYERNVASFRAQLGEEAWQKAWEEGRAMSVEQAVAYALEQLLSG